MTTSQLSIALCDNDAAALAIMEDFIKATLRFLKLEPENVMIESTQDSNRAEELAASGSLDLIITDLMWPIIGGDEWRQGLTIADVAKSTNQRTVVVVITSKTDQEQTFRDQARLRGADLAFTWVEAFGEGKVTSAKELAKRLAPSIGSTVPQIVGTERSTIGLVGLDTVAFSEDDDVTQEAVVHSFLGYLSNAWDQVGHSQVRPVFVFTGDGVFLGLVGDGGPRLALDVGVSAWRQFSKLAKYRTRIAVHSGPVNIVTLSTGTKQMLGHSVNWLFRAVDAAPDDGFVVTDEYFATVLQGGRENTPGLQFVRREAQAKHDRLLVIHEVSVT